MFFLYQLLVFVESVTVLMHRHSDMKHNVEIMTRFNTLLIILFVS